jgi:hypothetical protein
MYVYYHRVLALFGTVVSLHPHANCISRHGTIHLHLLSEVRAYGVLLQIPVLVTVSIRVSQWSLHYL